MGGAGDPRQTRAACGSCQRRRRSGAEAGATVHSRLEEAGTDSLEEAGAAELNSQQCILPGEEQQEGGQRMTVDTVF